MLVRQREAEYASRLYSRTIIAAEEVLDAMELLQETENIWDRLVRNGEVKPDDHNSRAYQIVAETRRFHNRRVDRYIRLSATLNSYINHRSHIRAAADARAVIESDLGSEGVATYLFLSFMEIRRRVVIVPGR